MKAKKKIAWIISLTPVTDEPRVRRQAQALLDNGWQVAVIGFPGRTKKPDGWNLIELKVPASSPPFSRLKNLLRRFCYRFSLLLLPLARFSNTAANAYYWWHFHYVGYLNYLRRYMEQNPEWIPSLIISHDYFTSPLVSYLSEAAGCRFVIDIHEYAKGQYMHSRLWRLLLRPWVDRMQRIFLPMSAFNTTVCDGIADLLAQDYAPMPRPTVVRSTPSFIKMPFRPTGDTVNVLYHGIVYKTRGLDLAVRSVPLWRPEFRLIIRGPGSEEYFAELRALAQNLGVGDRVRVEPPVLFNEIIPEANKADIGYFVHEDISPQKRFALPNKFFEYVMAGLALCISDLPEMARIVKQYDLGKLVEGFDEKAVADVINSFSRENIDQYKKNNLRAAKELCWENESHLMIEVYERVAQVGMAQDLAKAA